jgi:hypothetical protein
MPLASGLGIPPMTLGLRDLHLGVPIAGIAAILAALAQFLLGYRELMGLAGADHELTLAATAHFAVD